MTVKGILVFVTMLLRAAGEIANSQSPNKRSPLQATERSSGNNFAYVEVPGFGSFKGLIPSEGAAIFAGIPFSEPPIGENRWKNPIPITSVDCERRYYDATYSRPGCPQICIMISPEYACPSEIDEDCLYIDIYVPTKLLKKTVNKEGGFNLIDNIQDAKIPVMVSIHGGAFKQGSNNSTLTDGRFIAEKGEIILVIPNYRLGPLGFFYQNYGTADPALGNFGIWDQIEALRFLNHKISYFGGDPTQVTLFGMSAGAQSVAVHLTNKYSDPLFTAAILESNIFGLPYETAAESQYSCDDFVETYTTCTPNDMKCLRGLTWNELLGSVLNFLIENSFDGESLTHLIPEPWAPIIDNDLLSEHPFYTFLNENNQDKPIIQGSNKDEGMSFILKSFVHRLQSNEQYETLLMKTFGSENLTDILEFYPPNCTYENPFGDCDNRYPLNDVVTDFLFVCPSRRVFNTPSRYQNPTLKVWWYTFDQLWSVPELLEDLYECYDLVCHSTEAVYLFGVDKLTNYTFTDKEALLSDKMIYYWSNFVKYHNPNLFWPSRSQIRVADKENKLTSKEEDFLSDAAFWPRIYQMYKGSGDDDVEFQTMNLTGSGEEVVDNFKKEKCDFWDALDLYLKN